MRDQQQDKPSVSQAMDEAPDGATIDLHDVARGVNSGTISAEEQSTPQGETRSANAADDEPDDQPS